MRPALYIGPLVRYWMVNRFDITIMVNGLWNGPNQCHFGIGLGPDGDPGHRMDVEPRKDLFNPSYPLVLWTTFPITSSEFPSPSR